MSHATVVVAIDVPIDACGMAEVEKAVEHEMEPFDEEGGWFADGSRWDWYQIGGRWPDFFGPASHAMVRKGEFNSAAYREWRQREAEEWWEAGSKLPPGDLRRYFQFDIRSEDTTREIYLARKVPQHGWPVPRAFLRERHWHEGRRMGWFGVDAASECEMKKKPGKTKRCLTKGKNGARIVTWQEEDAEWYAAYFDRFIKPLPPETLLVAVDYHV